MSATRVARFAIVISPVLGMALLVTFGVAGVFRNGVGHLFDFRVLYGAGCWYRDGRMPYGHADTPACLAQHNLDMWFYAYPPHTSPLVLALSSLEFHTAAVVWSAVNVAAALAMAWLLARWVAQERGPQERSAPVLAAAFVLAAPFTAHVVWTGNPVLLVATCLVAAWRAGDRGLWLAAGLVLALASFKIQFAVFPGLWLLLGRRWSTLAAAAATVAALAGWHVAQFGLQGSALGWGEGLLAYVRGLGAEIGRPHAFGIAELFHHAGYSERWLKFALPFAGLAALALLFACRDRFTQLDQLGLITAISVLVWPVQDYDLVVVLPLAASLISRSAGNVCVAIPALVLAAFAVLPLRVVERLDMPLLWQWRVPVVLAAALLVVADALGWLRSGRRTQAASTAQAETSA